MSKVNWTDGAILTVSIASLDGGFARIGSALVALSDDRSFLGEIHRDLVEMLPNLSVHPGQSPGQGWIRVGIGGAFSELHVLLRQLPPGTDLILGQRAVELLSAAAS